MDAMDKERLSARCVEISERLRRLWDKERARTAGIAEILESRCGTAHDAASLAALYGRGIACCAFGTSMFPKDSRPNLRRVAVAADREVFVLDRESGGMPRKSR